MSEFSQKHIVTVDVILCLAENELAFRGTWETESRNGEGLFNSLFEFSIQKDKKLKKCVELIPQKAGHTKRDHFHHSIATTLDNQRGNYLIRLFYNFF